MRKKAILETNRQEAKGSAPERNLNRPAMLAELPASQEFLSHKPNSQLAHGHVDASHAKRTTASAAEGVKQQETPVRTVGEPC